MYRSSTCKPFSDLDLDTMALTVWAEARGEEIIGQRAVAWVIRNRWEQPGWWSRQRGDGIPDDTIQAVCRDPWQFSCWNPSDPQSHRLHEPATLRREDVQSIRSICERVLNESRDNDPTLGSDHYCTRLIAPHTKWAINRKPTASIGNHLFYRIGLHP
ncbi:MAG: cell wall hydrolase [Candidatus Obscuribacter sp.]|nr:cell wall hydrolase [Candidatus Obscuribacter sp.]